MLKEIYKINREGFIVDNYLGEFNEDATLISPVGEFITESLPQPLHFYKPKWNGSEWVEGESEEEKYERESLENLNSLQPTPEEIADSELEIKMLTLLLEMGIV